MSFLYSRLACGLCGKVAFESDNIQTMARGTLFHTHTSSKVAGTGRQEEEKDGMQINLEAIVAVFCKDFNSEKMLTFKKKSLKSSASVRHGCKCSVLP